MAGLVPAIHAGDRARPLEMPGTSPGMTVEGAGSESAQGRNVSGAVVELT